MERFTPAPWIVLGEENPRSRSLIMTENSSSGCVAECFKHSFIEGSEPETRQANAHLIAAAPEMHDSLEFIVGWLVENTRFNEFQEIKEWGVEADKLLAKARGE